jgi:hypothetical protein
LPTVGLVVYNLGMAMRRFELDDLLTRPGTYFNPQTEVLLVVDDSPELDGEIFNMEEFEGADWVLVSEELPIEEHVRDELLERFQSRHAPTTDGLLEADDEEEFDGFEVEEPDEEL